ncbi:MAG: RraA family protein [ANME-2 cluster archaeon]|jgi:regulator of RNase E activity RraA|nr:MAG: RraA family protein [ANME-2 cluster archaeon]
MKFASENELFDYLESHAYAAVFSDIMDEMGLRHQVISPKSKIKPLRDDFVTMGRCITLLNVYDGNKEDPYSTVIECIDNITPDSVLVTTGDASMEVGIMGELTATALKSRGARGAVVNGYSRDVRNLINMSYPTFAWGPSPIDTTGRVKVIDYNIPITIGGVTVTPGELIFADLDGIVIIPQSQEKEVISKTLERIQTENLVRKELAQGKKMREVWDKYNVL